MGHFTDSGDQQRPESLTKRVIRFRKGRCWLYGQQGFGAEELVDSPYVLTITESLFDTFLEFVAEIRTTELTTEMAIEYESINGYRFVIQLQRFDENVGQLVSVLNGMVPGARRPFVDISYLSGLRGTLSLASAVSNRLTPLVQRSTVSPSFGPALLPFSILGLTDFTTEPRIVSLEFELQINEVDVFGGGM